MSKIHPKKLRKLKVLEYVVDLVGRHFQMIFHMTCFSLWSTLSFQIFFPTVCGEGQDIYIYIYIYIYITCSDNGCFCIW